MPPEVVAPIELMLKDKVIRNNTILYCRHWLSTVVFYRDVLKLTVSHETDWMVEFRLFDESYLSIADTKRTTIEDVDGRGVTLSFQVQDVDGIRLQLQSAGIETSKMRLVWDARAFYIHDPEGHRVEIWA